jgi:hypothetical protein
MPVAELLLLSPDHRVSVQFALGEWSAGGRKWPGTPLWQVSLAGNPILRASRLGAVLDGVPLAHGLAVAGVKRHRIRREWHPETGDAAVRYDHANELVVRLRPAGPDAPHFDLALRCGDGAVAVQVRVPRQRGVRRTPPPALNAVARFPEHAEAWRETNAGFGPAPFDEAALPPDAPLLLNYPHGKLACIRPRPAVVASQSHTFEGVGLGRAPDRTPWQVVLVADRPADLPERMRSLPNLGLPAERQAASDDAVANCVAPFLGALPTVSGAVPPTPAHRQAFAVVAGAGEARWDETRFLRGEIGEYVVAARRRGGVWQVGAITGAEGRVITVRLEDLAEADRPCSLDVGRDPLPGEAADADGVLRETLAPVYTDEAPRIEMPPGGGFVLRLTPST